MTVREEVMHVIREQEGWDNVLVVPRSFIALTGDTDAALLLSQLLYWAERTSHSHGWVYKSRDEWGRELGFTRYRLDRARERLRKAGLIEEEHHLVNARRVLHLRPVRENLRASLKAAAVAVSHAENGRGVGRVAVSQAGMSSRSRLSGEGERSRFRKGEGDPSESCETVDPKGREATVRTVEPQPLEVSRSATPVTETRTETTPETDTETGGDDAREGMGKERRRRLPDGDNPPGVVLPGGELALPITAEEHALFSTLERVQGFPDGRNARLLRDVMKDYPGLDYQREFGKFAGYWKDQQVRHPWLMLRRWLEKAQQRGSESPRWSGRSGTRDKPFVVRRRPDGRCVFYTAGREPR